MDAAAPLDHAASDLAHGTLARIKALLVEAGFDLAEDFVSLHADTTVAGEPFIATGRLTPLVAERLAALAAAGARVVGRRITV